MLLHISFHAYLSIQKYLGLCKLNNVDWIKRVLDPICLYLSKLFYWRIILRQICILLQIAFPNISFFGHFLLFGLLGGLLGLAFHWAFLRIGF